MSPRLHTVTGAFGLTGRYVTKRLLAGGEHVQTITGHPNRPNPFGQKVQGHPFNFDAPDELTATLEGTDTLFCTYWVRFNRGHSTFDRAVHNLGVLFRSAKAAGVRRVVHVSIANAQESELPYYRGKAAAEQLLRDSGLSFGIVRPALLFGGRDVLINNIAWMLQRFPVFAIPGDGQYGVQPCHVDDLAALMVDLGDAEGNLSRDAGGPETYTYQQLVELVAGAVGRKPRLLHVPPPVALSAAKVIGAAVGDVVVTADELRGLMDDLLVCKDPPPLQATTSLSDFLYASSEELGARYASELKRHYR